MSTGRPSVAQSGGEVKHVPVCPVTKLDKSKGCKSIPKPDLPVKKEPKDPSFEKDVKPKPAKLDQPVHPKESPAKSAKKKKPPVKKPEPMPNKLVTDYFQPRKSGRVTARQVKAGKASSLHQKILSCCEDGLKVVEFEGKGRGVVAARAFAKDDFIVEYVGDIINRSEAKNREEAYEIDSSIGCYIYYFKHAGKSYCIDATAESGKMGRLVNHSRTSYNAVMKPVEVDGAPRLALIASRLISSGEEVLYDYGDRSKEAMIAFPWLAD